MISRYVTRNRAKKASKSRAASMANRKFKARYEMLEDRRVLAAFTPGDIVVYRVGTGAGSLLNTGNEVFLDEFSPTQTSGPALQSIAVPATASGSNNRLIASGTATSEGLITRSTDGQYLVFVGYDAPIPTSGLAGTSGTTNPRVVGRADGGGVVDTSTKFTDFSSGNNPRSAASTDGIDLWMGGGAGGVRFGQYQEVDNTSEQLTTTPTNWRQLAIFGGQLYGSSASGANIGINVIGSGLPESGTQTSTLLATSGITSPYGFYFADLDTGVAGVDTLYVADDALGLAKFSLVSGSWTSNGVVGVNADDYRGLAATVSGPPGSETVTLYATRKGGSNAAGGGELVKIVDATGYNGAGYSSLTATLIATAAANTAFRGVALAPTSPSAPPVVTTTGTALAYNEDGGAVAVDPGLTVTDDGVTLFGATVTISSNYANGQDVLSFTNQNGISGFWNAGLGALTLSGAASVANYQTALRSITYTNSSQNPSTATRTVTFVVSDAGGPSNSATRDITVNSINDAPVNSVPGNQSVGTNGSFAFSSLNGNLISIADVDAGAGAVQVTLDVGATGGSLTLNGTTGLSFTVGDGTADNLMTFTGTVADINAALNGMTYNAPATTGDVTLTVTTNDQGNTGTPGAQSDADTVTINVNNTPNSPPVVTTTSGDASFLENPGTPVAVDPTVVVTDSDDANLQSATVTISSNYANGQDVLLFTNQSGISGSWVAATGVLTLTGSATVAQYQAALRSITYDNTSETPNELTRTVTFVVRDGNDPSSPATRNVTVADDNDAPVNTVPSGTLWVVRDGSRVFSTANGNAFSIADVDAGASPVEFTLTTTNGTVALNGTAGLTGSGNGTASMTYTGTLAAINAALDGLTFTPTTSFTGTASIQLTANDQGNTGGGGPKTDIDLVNITVVAPAPLVINEIFVNPPGTDTGREYIEIRSLTPNFTFPAGTYLAGIEGDAFANPGDVQNIFDLSGFSTGSNGILLLLQEGGVYFDVIQPGSEVVEVFSGGGWGNNFAVPGSSEVNHSGDYSGTPPIPVDIENPSATFMLIQAPTAPTLTDDIDANNDGLIDGGGVPGNWVRLDSVASLDNSTDGDFGYGAINFINSAGNGSAASGTVVATSFTGGYLGRTGDTTGSAASDWVAGDNETGTVPDWVLSATDVSLAGFAGVPLDHVGGPNFPGIYSKPVADLNGTVAGRNTDAAFTTGGGPVVVGVGGALVTDFDSANLTGATITLTNRPDGSAESLAATTTGTPIIASYVSGTGVLTLSGTATLAQYEQVIRTVSYNNTAASPATVPRIINFVLNDGANLSLVSTSTVAVFNPNNFVVLNELEINPPATDNPYEYVELRGTAGSTLNNYYFVSLEGDFTNTPGSSQTGTFDQVVPLSAVSFGANGLLVIKSPTGGHTIPGGTTIVTDDLFDAAGGGLENGTNSFLLIFSSAAITEGTDYDSNDDGVLELPGGTVVVDSVGWSDGGATDIVYGGVELTQSSGTVDAATRFPGDLTHTVGAWYNADLIGGMPDDPAELNYDATRASANFPSGGILTPGAANVGTPPANQAPVVTTTVAALTYNENAGAVAIDTGLTVTDADSANLTGATVTISAGYVNGQDVLGFTDQLGITGNFVAATGILTLSGTASVADYQTALRSVTYANGSEDPSTATRTVSFVATDGTNTSAAAARTINVVASADAPVVTTTAGDTSYNKRDGQVVVDAGLTVSDIDSTTLSSATVTIQAPNYTSGKDFLHFTDQLGITGSFVGATGVLTLTGSASLADYQTALRSVKYSNNYINLTSEPRTISFVANDGSVDSAPATRTFDLYILGDMNGDGIRDNFDIQPFERALANPPLYQSLYPAVTDYELRGDINWDFDFDNFDIQPFEILLATGGGTAPEQGSMAAGSGFSDSSANDLAFALALAQAESEDDLLELLGNKI